MEEKDIPIVKGMRGLDDEEGLNSTFKFTYKYFPLFLFVFKGNITNHSIDNLDDLIFVVMPRIWRVFKRWIPDGLNSVKYFFQKMFRSHHTADYELWGLGDHLAKIILPKLIAFRNMNLHGHPIDFSEWEEEHGDYGGIGITKVDYDKAIESGDMVGGGLDKWLETLDEMIFSLEYMLYHDGYDNKGQPSRKRRMFYKKHGLLDPYRETDDNLSWHYRYKDRKNGYTMETSELLLNDEKYEIVGKFAVYLDHEESKKHAERAHEGFKLIGKYFWNLWD